MEASIHPKTEFYPSVLRGPVAPILRWPVVLDPCAARTDPPLRSGAGMQRKERNKKRGSAFSLEAGAGEMEVRGGGAAREDRLYAFGWNGAGQLGTGDTDNKKTACAVEPLADKRVAIVACGGPYTVLATDSEEVWGFGANARCVTVVACVIERSVRRSRSSSRSSRVCFAGAEGN